MTSSSDGVGSFAEHGVVEEPVAGLGVVATAVEAVVVGVTGWDGAEVLFAVEPGLHVVGGLAEAEPDRPAAQRLGREADPPSRHPQG